MCYFVSHIKKENEFGISLQVSQYIHDNLADWANTQNIAKTHRSTGWKDQKTLTEQTKKAYKAQKKGSPVAAKNKFKVGNDAKEVREREIERERETETNENNIPGLKVWHARWGLEVEGLLHNKGLREKA